MKLKIIIPVYFFYIFTFYLFIFFLTLVFYFTNLYYSYNIRTYKQYLSVERINFMNYFLCGCDEHTNLKNEI